MIGTDVSIDWDVDLTGLVDIPDGVTSRALFRDMCIQAVKGYETVAGGLTIREQRRLQSMRESMTQDLKTGDKWCTLVEKDFLFLVQCLETGRMPMAMNEIIMRVHERLEKAAERAGLKMPDEPEEEKCAKD